MKKERLTDGSPIQLTNQEGVQGSKFEIACQHKTVPSAPRQLLKRLAPQLSDCICNSQINET